MQKLIFLFLIIIATKAVAQPQRGDYMVGTGIAGAAANSTPSGYRNFGVYVYPQAGYFFTNNFVLGAATGLGYSATKGSYWSVDYEFSPFGRYYVSSKKQLRFFGEVSTGLHGYRAKIGGTENSNTGMKASAGPGLSYLVNSNVAIESVLRLQTGSMTSGLNQMFTIGFQVYLPGKNSRVPTVIK
jgi:hypothetical protein